MKKITIEMFNDGLDITNVYTNECYSMDWDTFWISLEGENSKRFKKLLFESIFCFNKPFKIVKYKGFNNFKFLSTLVLK